MKKDQQQLNDAPLEEKTYASYDAFYDDIPVEGSLGILAMGASGVIPWRIKREKAGIKPEFILPEEHEDDGEA
ncbi:MAG: hypothetical protein K9M49_05725 [Candidatus Marinimicrobia bacterium]|nr:hypothetical protein [Candidatus Neomarinimicrobiota bacterium]MCF7904633.1 hypothetical protein [Candidatus Neomarinimicrobiota bacterium]